MVRWLLRLILVTSAVAWLAGGCGSDDRALPGGEGERADRRLVVSATVRVGQRGDTITGVAVGEGAVWIASAGRCPGSVSRIDPERNEVGATIPVDVPLDIAVGAGAVWALGGSCSGGEGQGAGLFRVDPRTDEVVATIPLDLRLGGRQAEVSNVAADEDAVWVTLNFDTTRGEVVRIDPRSEEIVARISARGYAGELALGNGGVWVLSHPEWTDEATGAGERASLLRIDPRTNPVAAIPLREELPDIGGTEIPPLMAVGEDAVWVRSFERRDPHATLAIRVHARTDQGHPRAAPVRAPLAVRGHPGRGVVHRRRRPTRCSLQSESTNTRGRRDRRTPPLPDRRRPRPVGQLLDRGLHTLRRLPAFGRSRRSAVMRARPERDEPAAAPRRELKLSSRSPTATTASGKAASASCHPGKR